MCGILLGLAIATNAGASDTSARHYNRSEALSARDVREGRIIGIRQVTIDNNQRVTVGAGIGGAAAYALTRSTNPKYRSTTRIAATAAGAVVGNAIHKALTSRKGVEIIIQTTDQRGKTEYISVVQDNDQQIHEGQRVIISGRGKGTRIAVFDGLSSVEQGKAIMVPASTPRVTGTAITMGARGIHVYEE
ncbi:hypothetical protein [Pseudoxanthomonas winnipegensis]|uniref:Glycine zipper 2TM domain-containing protein n=1 Tax=Pseudoxanthomonas winnipegensis TaxID=2480810 RepID=A0A4Q8M2J6_9GAMM|nr:hypothetical protein [Pseudoxanthomonas winnipegensis]TAA41568.1 hypothetical protein EA655_11540 [Pseudoxanthomonas winnipegensis]